MDEKIKELLQGLTDVEDPIQLRSVTAAVREAICAADMPADLAEAIRASYAELGKKVGERISVDAPSGEVPYEILEVSRS